uniref:NADH-ubiquinone oxidoreductase chain 2 n=1 Tax=Siphonaria gigas TaxID=1087063 RepID=G8HSG1_9GAST|nr:NADH dehydrogenase subunit 2 [Siphonaria gigas]AEQ93905.1 NADH dehydrogenase subunit 2 [Siphonaria gigas]
MGSVSFLFFVLMSVGVLVSVSSSSWIICWAGIELSFLGMIPLLLFGGYISLNKESSLKYFCVQALGSALLFLSGLMVYSGGMLGGYWSIFFGGILVLSLCIKLGMFPGHFWVPSVLAGLEWVSCFVVLSVQKVPVLALLMNFLGDCVIFQSLVLFLGGVSALVGGLLGNNQTSIRAVVGASSIAHTGWVSIGAVSGAVWGYFGIYCGVLGLTFLYLWQSSSFFSSLMLLSLSGLPPFLMFIGKWAVVQGALSSYVSVWFLILPLLGALISLSFYLKFAYSFYLDSSSEGESSVWSSVSFSVFSLFGVIYLFLV